MSVIASPPAWPADPGHRDAIETLLAMAEAEYRWGATRRALHLLDHVERIVGTLPERFQLLRAHAGQRLTEG